MKKVIIKSIILITFISTAVFCRPDTQELLNKSTTAFGARGFFMTQLERNGSTIDHEFTSLNMSVSLKKYLNKGLSFDITPDIGYMNYSSDNNSVNINLGIGITKYFINDGKGFYTGFQIRSNNHYFYDILNGNSIGVYINPGYMIQITNENYLTIGPFFGSEYFYSGRDEKFNDLNIVFSFGITQYY